MSGVVLIISIPTEEHEKHLLKKIRKKENKSEKSETPSGLKYGSVTVEFDKDYLRLENEDEKEKEYNSMEQIIRSTVKDLDIIDVTWRKTDDNNHYQIIFPLVCGDKCEETLEILKAYDIGKKLNSKISVMPCTIHYHGNEVNENEEYVEDDELFNEKKNSGWNLFVSSVTARLTVAQVVENVKAKAAMTFDFIMLLLISTTLCALGLVENNNIYMLSSMLISPMMGPVMAATFGSIIRDKNLRQIGVRNELIGLGIATVVGFCYGSIICITTDKYGTSDWPTYEMYSRGEFRSLWVGAIIALLSGAAVALGVLSDNIASLVGVAISTSLMPPAVNAGLLWSMGFVYYIKKDEATRYTSLTHTDYFSTNSAIELSALGAISICLTFVNIVCIFVAAILVFMIKEVAPNAGKDNARKRFWRHDIKITRDYNKTIQFGESNAYQSILQQLSETQTFRDFHHYSTDLSKANYKVNIKRHENTWSPCFNDVYYPVDDLTNSMPKYSSSGKKFLDLFPSQDGGRTEYRRLSQIFPRNRHDSLETVPEKVTERTPLLMTNQEIHPKESTYFLSSGKKVVVTPCNDMLDAVKA